MKGTSTNALRQRTCARMEENARIPMAAINAIVPVQVRFLLKTFSAVLESTECPSSSLLILTACYF